MLQIVDRFSTQKGNRGAATNSGISRRISLFHKNLKFLSGVRIEKIKVIIFIFLIIYIDEVKKMGLR